MDELQSIRVVKVSKGRYCISVVWGGCRYRFYNGHNIGSWSKPQALPQTKRLRAMEDLCLEYQRAIDLGWTPLDDWSGRLKRETIVPKSILKNALELKLKQGLSEPYSRNLKWIVRRLMIYLKGNTPTPERLAAFINESHWTPATKTIVRRHLITLEKQMSSLGYVGSIKPLTTKFKTEEKLHKPFKDVVGILVEIEAFNPHLHLCCLLAFGCLLRPHREIRLLTWGDISEDMSSISLAGNRNKGKRNRIVPVSPFIRPYLRVLKPVSCSKEVNVFSGKEKPYNRDFFKTLWGRFKKQSELLEHDQTLYSFRHTGAIQVYEKTGSLTKLQQVLGHSTLQVSLTYLRGLEVRQIDQDDMPSFTKFRS